MEVAETPPTITCPECGGTCHLVTIIDPDEPPEPGDVLAYQCEDCPERWDIVVEDAGADGAPPPEDR